MNLLMTTLLCFPACRLAKPFNRELMAMKGVANVEAANLHPVCHRLVFVAVVNCSRLSTLRGKSAVFFRCVAIVNSKH